MLTPRFIAGVLSVGLIIGAGAVRSQDYPNKPIRLMVDSIGSASDTTARIVAPGISGPLGQRVIADNRSGYLPAEIVAKAPPDGYTLLLDGGSFWIGPLLQKVPYDVRIPYRSGSVEMADLMAGNVPLSFAGTGSATQHIKTGRLKAIAVTSAQPSALFPGLPTIAASGLPGYDATGIRGLLAPAKTPAPIINRLNQEIVRFVARPDVKEQFLNIGLEVASSSPEELAARINLEITKWGKVIKDVGIKAD